MNSTNASGFAVRPTDNGIGADLVGASVARDLESPHFMATLRSALKDHLVVRLRHQVDLHPRQLRQLGAAFGPLMDLRRAGNDAVHLPEADYIKVISNSRGADGRPLGDGNSKAQTWHTDAAAWEVPPGWLLFYARDVPSSKPGNGWINMLSAWDALTPQLQQRIAPLRCIQYQYPNYVEMETHLNGRSLPLEERQRGRSQPLVRRHLETGRAMLFLPVRRDSLIEGMDEATSFEILAALWDCVEHRAARWETSLEIDDLVFMDNRATVHNRGAWPSDERRVLWHLSIAGETPTPMFPQLLRNISIQM